MDSRKSTDTRYILIFILLRMIDNIGHMGRWKWSSIFWTMYHSQKNYALKSYYIKIICQILHQKKIQKVFIKTDEIADIFLHLASCAQKKRKFISPKKHLPKTWGGKLRIRWHLDSFYFLWTCMSSLNAFFPLWMSVCLSCRLHTW